MTITEVKNKVKTNQLAIQNILGWSEMQYNEYQFDSAFDYLIYRCGIDSEYIKIITQSSDSLFWAWWKNSYGMLEQQFVNEFEAFTNPTHEERMQLLEYYILLHDVSGINLFPSKMIFETLNLKISLCAI
jgi:hypothetical protein